MRHLKNGLAFIIILAVAVAAYLYYAPGGGPEIKGVTTGEKFQAVAKVVSDKYSGKVMVIYLESSIPGFIVASAVPPQDIKTQQDSLLMQQKFYEAMAMALRLTATEILPLEPSIQAVGMTIITGGTAQIFFAMAEDLKMTPADAENKTWVSKLKPVGADTAPSDNSDAPQSQ